MQLEDDTKLEPEIDFIDNFFAVNFAGEMVQEVQEKAVMEIHMKDAYKQKLKPLVFSHIERGMTAGVRNSVIKYDQKLDD